MYSMGVKFLLPLVHLYQEIDRETKLSKDPRGEDYIAPLRKKKRKLFTYRFIFYALLGVFLTILLTA